MSEEVTAAPVATEAAPAPVKEKRKRGPNKPLQGKFELSFLQETTVPDRKPLQGGGATGPRDTTLTKNLAQLAANPGKLAVIFTSPEPKEVFIRRASLIQAADRIGVKLNEKQTASRAYVRDGQPVMSEDGKTQLYALYAMVGGES